MRGSARARSADPPRSHVSHERIANRSATALAVARHHRARYAAIAASDGRWLEVHLDGHTCLTPPTSDTTGWPSLVRRALERLAALRRAKRQFF